MEGQWSLEDLGIQGTGPLVPPSQEASVRPWPIWHEVALHPYPSTAPTLAPHRPYPPCSPLAYSSRPHLHGPGAQRV